MATFGCFAGLASGAMGALCSSEAQLLRLCDFPAVASSSSAAAQETSSQVHHESCQQPDSNHRSPAPAQRRSLMSRFSIAKLAPEFDGIGCFDTVFGWQSS